MRMFGYVLLFAGFLWLAYDAVIALPHGHYVVTRDMVAEAPRAWADRVRPGDVFPALWGFYYREKAQGRVILLPSCLMFVGGLMLRLPREPEIMVEGIPAKRADSERRANESLRISSAAQLKRKRIVGYILLLLGLLWLVQNGVVGIERYQYRITDRIVKRMTSLGEEVPRAVAIGALWDLQKHLMFRQWLLLLPAGLMLAGGLMVGAQRPPVIIVERNPGDSADIKQLGSRDYIGRPPKKNVAYRKGLLGLVRRAVAGSAFFSRSQKQQEGVDTDGP